MALRLLPFLALVAADSSCESSLLQHSSGRLFSESTTFNSPEFQELLPEMDANFTPISQAKMPPDMCLRMVAHLSSAHKVMKRRALIHTGIVLPEGPSKMDEWVETARKLRLLPLSYLATQNLQNSTLYFWANANASHPLLQEIFQPLMEKYGPYIEIKTFDLATELRKLAAVYAPEDPETLTANLLHIFKSQREITSQSDMMRLILLYNYGGAWMDSDVLLVQDLAPVLEEDWAVLFQKSFVNQGTLSTSAPHSPFTVAYLSKVLTSGVMLGWSAYGPAMVTNMVKEMQASVANRTFHVLPRCFFEGTLDKKAHLVNQKASGWSQFFDKKLDMQKQDTAMLLNYIDPVFQGHMTFGFHWHNRWNHPIAPRSLADRAEKLYCQQLDLTLHDVDK